MTSSTLQQDVVNLTIDGCKAGMSGNTLLFDNFKKEKPKLVTDKELARQLSLSVHTIRKWRAQGRIVPKMLGRSVRYSVEQVLTELEQKGKKYRAK